jgi:Domain of unknown function (DUF3303)
VNFKQQLKTAQFEYLLLEGDDPKALAAFAHMWGDLMELSIVPVLEDEAILQVLDNLAKQSS